MYRSAFFLQARGLNQTQAVHSMACRFGICLSCLVVGTYGGAVAPAQYTLNLQPPEENTHDVLASLDATMKAEDEKRILSDTEFAAAKQRLINIEKQRIQDIVREAFQSA